MAKPAPRGRATAFDDPTNNNAYGGSSIGKAAWKQYSQQRQSAYQNKIVEPDPSLQPQPATNGQQSV